MRISKNTNDIRDIQVLSTEKVFPKTKQIFLDECVFIKTENKENELIFISIPKKFKGVIFPNSSKLITFAQNQSNELFSIVRHYLAQEDCVKKILFLKKDDILRIWTAISDYNIEENRRLIYKKEIELMQFLSKAQLHFDFYLINLEDVNDILSSGAVVIYDK